MSSKARFFCLKNRAYRLVCCASLALLVCLALPTSADTLSLTSELKRIQLGPYLDYIEDPSGTLTLDQVREPSSRWQDSEQDVLNFGYSVSAYWLRAGFTQAQKQPHNYLLEVAYPVLDHVEVYIFENGAQVAQYLMGDLQPYFQRPVDHTHFLVPLVVRPEVATIVYLRVLSTSSVQVPMSLTQELTMVEVNYHQGMIQALFFGAMLVMAVYNLLIFFSIRDVNYLYYVLVVVSIVTLLGGIQGLTFRYLWPNTPELNTPVLIAALNGIVIFSALLFRRFLETGTTRPILDKAILVLAILAVFTMATAFYLPYRSLNQATIMLAVGGIMMGFWTAIVRWRDGFEAAKYLNIAWSVVLVGGIIFAFNKLGFLPRNVFTENVMQIATGMQALLLSFALAYRMNSEREQREKAEQESAAAQKALLNQQIKANENLDLLVKHRAAELQQANKKLEALGATDSLTQLLNRRAFEERFLIEYERAYRNQSPLAVLMVDLDHFKQINDNYGHLFGDTCLTNTAQVIKASLSRASDIVARYGGEEFLVMLPDTDVQGAASIGQAILDALAGMVVDDGSYSVTLTASIGVAAHIPQNTSDREELLKEADRYLYLAKGNGRNRVERQHGAPSK
ncbi:diguanylate cyclase [uncultured Halopseudomonas sp.]|uniref:sensor domain-containing diguanylate cyclase n=1 Tax=uncultured Halopseudomonas sp. TaxID=2901193 RepID=UPI0030EF6988|tara:strand:- start:129562 stop:131433 length:1872 start_codon:yes stop_codon:yes gene_type:complete